MIRRMERSYFIYIYHRLLQSGGPDGELAASMRYLSQRYSMPYKEVTGILTDIGTEELARNYYRLFGFSDDK